MLQIPQSTARRVLLKLFDAGTTTAATGKTLAVVLSKAGGAFGNPSAGATNATELSNGWYYVDLSTTDTGTLGDLIVRGTASGCDDSERLFGVVSATTGGLTALATGVPLADGAITDAKITLPAVSGVATGALGMLQQIWRRFFKKVVKDSSTIKTYNDDGSTATTTQTYTSAGSTDTVNEAT